MQTMNVKQEARKLVDQLSESSTWEDLMYEIYVRQAIEAGLADSKENRTIEVGKLRQQFGLEK